MGCCERLATWRTIDTVIDNAIVHSESAMNDSWIPDSPIGSSQILADIVPVDIAPANRVPANGRPADGLAAGVGLRLDAHTDSRKGCPWHDVQALLQQVKLRPTRQRMAPGWLLFAKGGRHLAQERDHESWWKQKRLPIGAALSSPNDRFSFLAKGGSLAELVPE
jgi:hypothetical protein